MTWFHDRLCTNFAFQCSLWWVYGSQHLHYISRIPHFVGIWNLEAPEIKFDSKSHGTNSRKVENVRILLQVLGIIVNLFEDVHDTHDRTWLVPTFSWSTWIRLGCWGWNQAFPSEIPGWEDQHDITWPYDTICIWRICEMNIHILY